MTYIFIHVMPELAEWQEVLQDKALNFLEHHTYLIALIGLSLFYGLEKAAKQSRQSDRSGNDDEMPLNLNVFWLHILSFAFYNAIIGYLLAHREEHSGIALVWFTLAMAFHFVVNDYALVEHYRDAYMKKGRWVISVAIIGGWLVGVLTKVPEFWISILFAFIAGGTIMNVLKEELPEERKSNFWAFMTGMIIYAALLLVG